MIEAAVFGFEAQLTTIIPHQTPCLSCIYPEFPKNWKRQFPILGAVSGSVANLAALEGLKWITGLGPLLTGWLLLYDTKEMNFRKIKISKRKDCPICNSNT